MGFFDSPFKYAKITLIACMVIILIVAGTSLYLYFDLKAQQDTATAQTELEAKLEKARLEGYLLSGQNVITAINNQFFNQGFLSLPIKGQDGEYVQVRFYTEQQCAAQCVSECSAELDRIIQGGR